MLRPHVRIESFLLVVDVQKIVSPTFKEVTVGIFRKRVLVVGRELQALVEPIRALGYEALFGERHNDVLHLATAFNPSIALISEIEFMRNPQLRAELDRLLGSTMVSVLSSASVPTFLERPLSAQAAGEDG